MADFTDAETFLTPSFDTNSSTISGVLDSVDSVDTGNTNASENVVTLDNVNIPSVINNNNNSDSTDPTVPPDPTIVGPSQNEIAAVNSIAKSMATNPDGGGYNPFSPAQINSLLQSMFGTAGGHQVSAGGAPASGSKGGSSIPLSLPKGSQTPSSPKASPTSTTGSPTTTTAASQTGTTPVSGTFLGLSITQIALILGVIASVIAIVTFMRKK